jgi:hypothetical protein
VELVVQNLPQMELMSVRVRFTLVVVEELVHMLSLFLEQMDLYYLQLLLMVDMDIKPHLKQEFLIPVKEVVVLS